MSEREPPGDEAVEPDAPDPRPPSSAHARPLPSRHPGQRLFETPSQPPKTRPRPPKPPEKPKPPEPSKPPSAFPAERVQFPVARTPPRVPESPPGAEPEPPASPEQDAEDEATPEPQVAPVVEAVARRGAAYGYVLYLALAIGTVPLPGEVRYVLLWMVLLGLGAAMLFFDQERPVGATDPLRLTWGLGIGFVLGLPLMLTASRGLARTSVALIPLTNLPALFQALVITWPLADTLFYRGVVQREHGLVVAGLAAGLGNLLLYWPETGGVFAVLFVAAAFSTALGFVYSYVRLRYGMAAAYTCHVMTNFMLIFLPRLLTPVA